MPDVRRLAARVGALALALGTFSPAAAQPVLITSPTTVGPLDTEITGSDGTIVPLATAEITVRGATLTINGRHEIASLAIEAGAMVTHDAGFEFDYSGIGSDLVHGMVVIASGDIIIDTGGRITASGRGFAGGQGPGTASDSECGITGSRSAGGGGYGGDGGNACVGGGVAYGDPLRPESFGSGGGTTSGGRGGGALRLVAMGVVEIEGTVSSDGARGGGDCCRGGGGGAGGAVWIEGSAILGQGMVTAIGGVGHSGTFTLSGTGGGGRIRVDGNTDAFAGQFVASGGDADRPGGAGTVVLAQAAQTTLIVDNLGIAGARTDLPTPLAVDHMLVTGGAIVSAQPLAPLVLTVRGDLVVDADAQISVTGRGYAANSGPGAGRDYACGLPGARAATGGAHGGFGGGSPCHSGPGPYGDVEQPITYGSGGGRGNGGRGGGAARISVGGQLRVDGAILANGNRGSGDCCSGGGGGAGGSLIVSAGSIGGAGAIRADGGAGHSDRFTRSGGGGGGRIAIYTCDLDLPAEAISVRNGPSSGGLGSIYIDATTVTGEDRSLAGSIGSTVRLDGTLSGAAVLSRRWMRNGVPLEDGPTPWGSTLSGTREAILHIANVRPEDAGAYGVRGEATCGSFERRSATLDVLCASVLTQTVAGMDDRFRAPAEPTQPSTALRDALLNRRPGRPFHQFDEIPAVTPGIEADSRLAHTFIDLPADIVAATLTMRLRAGGTGTASPVAEGTDSIRLGFATGTGPDAQLNTAWDRRIGGTDLDPDLGLLAGELWEMGDEALIELDLSALPISTPLGAPGGPTTSLIDALNTNGFLDVVVADETGVDFLLLEIETSDGTVTPWAVGPQDASACEGERAEFTATTGGVGGPFTYQWRRDGVAIDPGENPTAAEATLVLDPVTLADYASYDVIVAGDNTCGDVTTASAMLNDFGCCAADFDADGVLTVFDFLAFQNAFDAMDPAADLDGDGAFTLFDFLAFQTAFDAGCG